MVRGAAMIQDQVRRVLLAFAVALVSLFGTATAVRAATNQVITFTSTPPNDARISGPAYTPVATGGASGNPVVFSAFGGCLYNPTTGVSFLAAGPCTIRASQAGNVEYNEAQNSQTIIVGRLVNVITFQNPGDIASFVQDQQVDLQGLITSSVPEPITVSTTTASVCMVSGFAVTVKSSGTCTLIANAQASPLADAAEPVSQSFQIGQADPNGGKQDQTIVFTSTPPNPAQVFGLYRPTATGGESRNPVTFTVSGGCLLFGFSGQVLFVAPVPACVIKANQGGNAEYNAAAEVQQVIDVQGFPQTITFQDLPDIPDFVAGEQVDLSNLISFAGSPATITLTSTSTACTVTNFVVTIVSPGTCIIDANARGFGPYEDAPQVTRSFEIGPANPNFVKQDQAITFTTTPPSPVQAGSSFFSGIVATGGASGNPVVITASGSCYTFGNSIPASIAFNTPGQCIISANQDGNARYNAAPEVQTVIDVEGLPLTITFQDPPDIPNFILNEQVDLSGLLDWSPKFSDGVTLTTGSTACSITGSLVTVLSPGTCTIDANMPARGEYNAAEQVTQSFDIGPADPNFAPLDQTITLDTPPSNAQVYSVYSPVLSGGASGNPVVITPSGSCGDIGSSTVYFTSRGECVIRANQAGNGRYNPAPEVEQIISVQGQPATVFFQDPPDIADFVSGEQVDLANFVSTFPNFGPGKVVFTTNSAACTVSENIVTIVSPGTCSIDANSSASEIYEASPLVSQSFEVGPADPNFVKQDQTITLSFLQDLNRVSANQFYSLSTTGGNSGNPVVLTASGSCSITSLGFFNLSTTARGQCIISANQAGNARFNEAPEVQQIITVRGFEQFINFFDPPDIADFVADEQVDLSRFVTSPFSTNIVLSTTSSSCTVSGSVATVISPGTCTIDANSPAFGQYEAASQVSQSFEIGPADPNFVKQDQTITFTSPPPESGLVQSSYTPFAIGGASLNPVEISANGSCFVSSGQTVQFDRPGQCIITANQAGNARFNPAPEVRQVVTVTGLPQQIFFQFLPDIPSFVQDQQIELQGRFFAPAPVVFSTTSTACSVSGTVVTVKSPGLCTIDANAPAFAIYEAAEQASRSFTIGQIPQNITDFVAPETQTFAEGATLTLSATGGESGNPVVFASDTPEVCTVTDTTVALVGAGSCSINATQAGNDLYLEALPVTASFEIIPASQTITNFAELATQTFVPGASLTLSATGGASGNPVVFASNTTDVCAVAGATVTVLNAGSCSITASQTGSGNYLEAAAVTQSFQINPAQQSITNFAVPATQTFAPGATLALTATGGASGNPVVFASDTTDICTVAGTTVTIVGAGTCSVTANQAGSANYLAAAAVNESFTINPAAQSISFTSIPPAEATIGVGSYILAATGGASGNAVVFSVVEASAGVCAIADNIVTFTGAGNCTLNANQAGTANYTAAPQVQQSFSVVKRLQSITFTSTPPTNAAINGNTYTVAATASSGLPVTYSIDATSAAVCSIAGSTVSFIGEGTCIINANQAGDALYAAAQQVQQGSITVVDNVGPATENIGNFTANRANQIVSNLFDSDRQVDRLLQAQNAQNNSGSNGTAFTSGQVASKGDRLGLTSMGLNSAGQQQSRLGGGIGSTVSPSDDMFGLQAWLASQLMPLNNGGELQRLTFGGPLSGELMFGDQLSGSFSTSLSQFESWQNGIEQKQMSAMGLGMGSGASRIPQEFQRFDLWAEGAFTSFTGDKDGHFGMVTLGADYVFSPNFLAGVYGMYDTMEQTSGTRVEGQGYLIGPYATARLVDNLFWQGRAGWGKSSNTIYSIPTDGDDFDSTRWLLASSLTGRWQLDGGLTLSPTAAFTWYQDKTDSYRDGSNVLIPGVKTELGQLKLAPEISYVFNTENGTRIEPSFNADLLWNFESTSVAGRSDLLGEASGPDGLRGRVGVGLKIQTPEGVSVTAKGSYDGIGQSDYSALTGRVGVLVQF
jgi:hypothetical protein